MDQQDTTLASENPNQVSKSSEQVQEAHMANVKSKLVLHPTLQAALTLKRYNQRMGEINFHALVDGLLAQCNASKESSLKRTESMLMTQAQTLDAIFHNLARKADECAQAQQFDTFLRLALKAQNQCRSTLETLASIKNPSSVAFVRQTNIAHGAQQVNNLNEKPPTKIQKPAKQTIEGKPCKPIGPPNGEHVRPQLLETLNHGIIPPAQKLKQAKHGSRAMPTKVAGGQH